MLRDLEHQQRLIEKDHRLHKIVKYDARKHLTLYDEDIPRMAPIIDHKIRVAESMAQAAIEVFKLAEDEEEDETINFD